MAHRNLVVRLVSLLLLLCASYAFGAVTEFPVCTAPADQDHPAIYGAIVVWQDHRESSSTGWDVYGYDLDTDSEFPICSAAGDQTAPAICGSIVAWEDSRNFELTGWDIYGYGLSSHTEFPICTAAGDQERPSISNGMVVWEDARTELFTGWDVYGRDLNAEQDLIICTAGGDQLAPSIAGDLVVWQDARDFATSGWDLYGRYLSSGAETQFATGWSDQSEPFVVGPKWGGYFIFWTDARYDPGDGSNLDVYGGSDAGWEFAVCTEIGNQTSAWWSPFLGGIWVDTRNDPGNPEAADLCGYWGCTPHEFSICTAPGRQSWPAATRDDDASPLVAVWSDTRNAGVTGTDIYGARVHVMDVLGRSLLGRAAESGEAVPLDYAGFMDSAGHRAASLTWDDGGAGGSFSPSPDTDDPTYTAPVNLGTDDLAVTLTVTVTCDGPQPLTGSFSFDLPVRPAAPEVEAGTVNLPSAMTWGQPLPFSVSADNTGDLTWTAADGYELVALPSRDRWGVPSVPIVSDVAPGGSYTFDFTISAPPLTTLRYGFPLTPTSLASVDFVACDWSMARNGEEFGDPVASSDVVISRFPDIQPGSAGAWARWYVEECAGRAPMIVGGYEDGTYRPSLTVDRGAMAVFMARALKLSLPSYQGRFNDVPSDHWAAAYIEALAGANVVSGYEDGSYRPADLVNRGAMAVYVARGLAGGDSFVPPGPETASFPDVLPSHWAFKYVEYAKAHGVVGGYPDGSYWPDLWVDRGQMAVYVFRGFIQPTGTPVVLGGPAITLVDPQTAIHHGWSSRDSISTDDPGYAYAVFDGVRLGTNLAYPHTPSGVWEVRFELRSAAAPELPATGEYTSTVAFSSADIETAHDTAMGSGMPYCPVSWDIPAGLSPGDYLLVVSVTDETGTWRQSARREALKMVP